MPGRLRQALDRWHQARVENRWSGLAARAGAMDPFDLRALKGEARGIRRQLDRVIQSAEARLAAPLIGRALPQMPLGTDWAWRPEAWSAPLPEPGGLAASQRTALGENLALYHDCPLGEIVVRQLRNDPADSIAPYGIALDIFGFQGSFLSLAMNLPEAGVTGLQSRHLVRAALVVDCDHPLRGFARLNIKHGPNLSQPVSDLPSEGSARQAEFDLAYADINEKRVERAWVDLILNDVAMTRIVIRDVVLSRRPRAEL